MAAIQLTCRAVAEAVIEAVTCLQDGTCSLTRGAAIIAAGCAKHLETSSKEGDDVASSSGSSFTLGSDRVLHRQVLMVCVQLLMYGGANGGNPMA